MRTNEKGCLVRVMVYLLESILSSALLYQNVMIYLLVLHILACTDDVPDSHCTSSLVLHILTCIAYPHLYCISSLVLHILTCIAYPHLYCISSLVLHILTCTAYPQLHYTSLLMWHIVYTGCFCQRVLKKVYNIWVGQRQRVQFRCLICWKNGTF